MREDLIELPRLLRPAEIRAQSFDKEASTVDVIFTTGATVRRYSWMGGPYDEELVVSANSVRLDRLNAGASFLNSHNAYDLDAVLGCVVPGSARIAKGAGVATIQLTRREDVAGIVRDIADGVIRNISAGYCYHKIEKTEADDATLPKWRVVDWESLEISAVTIPADPGAQTRSDAKGKPDGELFPCVRTRIVSPESEARSAILVSRARMRMLAEQLK